MKELLLLEDHLAKSDQRCLDCIRKHTLKVEALAEEAKGLDEAEAWRGVASWLANQARAIGAAAEQGQELAQLAQGVRTVRKKVVKALESTGENMAGVYGALGFYGAAGPGAAGSAVASAVATDAGAGAGVNWRNVFLGITVGVVTAVVSQVVLDKVRGRRRGSAA
ncbi:MAG: hypothetical protein Q8Q85_09735 [Gemmatimonadales bacterium]|nr:hypothetical protein [Gemmatimonadales bacterium]